jgi:hypothetical protein
MDQNDGGLGPRAAAGKANLRHVQPRALDVNELAGGRMSGLNPRDAECAHDQENAKQNGKGKYWGRRDHECISLVELTKRNGWLTQEVPRCHRMVNVGERT